MKTLLGIVVATAILLPVAVNAQQPSAQRQYVSSLAMALLDADGEVDALRQQLIAAQKAVADLSKERDDLKKQIDAAKSPDSPKP